eukprot:365928-Chlamydomonas_euryale.AAC.4
MLLPLGAAFAEAVSVSIAVATAPLATRRVAAAARRTSLRSAGAVGTGFTRGAARQAARDDAAAPPSGLSWCMRCGHAQHAHPTRDARRARGEVNSVAAQVAQKMRRKRAADTARSPTAAVGR